MIGQFAQFWDGAKLDLQTALSIGRDGPHAHIGILIFVVLLALTRGRWLVGCWLVTLAAEVANEALDLSWAGPESSLAASGHDLFVTMAPPTLVVGAIMWVRRRAART